MQRIPGCNDNDQGEKEEEYNWFRKNLLTLTSIIFIWTCAFNLYSPLSPFFLINTSSSCKLQHGHQPTVTDQLTLSQSLTLLLGSIIMIFTHYLLIKYPSESNQTVITHPIAIWMEWMCHPLPPSPQRTKGLSSHKNISSSESVSVTAAAEGFFEWGLVIVLGQPLN